VQRERERFIVEFLLRVREGPSAAAGPAGSAPNLRDSGRSSRSRCGAIVTEVVRDAPAPDARAASPLRTMELASGEVGQRRRAAAQRISSTV
jgi:hypothetical protein